LRYEILFHQGGLYVDHDMECLQSFEGFHRTYDLYCGLEPPHPSFVGWNVTVGNGLIASRAGHPALKRVMELVDRRWDELAQKYPGKDGFSRTQIVMERTYMAFTHAVIDQIDQRGFRDVIFPAAWFFAKKGMTPMYSKHFYANTWAQLDGKNPQFERDVQKSILKLEKRYSRVVFFALGALSFNLLLLGFVIFCGRKARSI
jgi:glycosyl transferase-like sugar-binding protein